MELTLAEQLMNSCNYFTGLGDKSCRAGIEYSTVRNRSERTISCMKLVGSFMSHNDLCTKQEFPTLAEAEVVVAKERARGEKIAAGICPDCDGILEDRTRRSGRFKGHGKIVCPVCEKAIVII